MLADSIDLKTGAHQNTMGAPELTAGWTDPEFDPESPDLYYTRTLEIPTPRWTTYDAIQNGLPLPKGVPPALQERAWTSPIWYLPGM